MCVYFEVDRTNIPYETIAPFCRTSAPVQQPLCTDIASGKTVLSVTTLKYAGKPDQEVIGTIEKEIKRFAGVKRATSPPFPHPPSPSRPHRLAYDHCTRGLLVQDKVVLAGDHLLNGSLNAAIIGVSCGPSPAQQRQSAPH